MDNINYICRITSGFFSHTYDHFPGECVKFEHSKRADFVHGTKVQTLGHVLIKLCRS